MTEEVGAGTGPKPAVRFLWLGILAVGLAWSAGCGSEDPKDLVTSTEAPPATTARPTTTSPPLTTTAATTAAPDPVSDPAGGSEAQAVITPDTTPGSDQVSYRVVRQESTRDGARLFVEIPPGSYSDVDLENLVMAVYEERDDLFEVHVVDNREAVWVLVKPAEERSSEEAELLDRHYLVSLLEGSMIRFQGPFADLGGFVIGS